MTQERINTTQAWKRLFNTDWPGVCGEPHLFNSPWMPQSPLPLWPDRVPFGSDKKTLYHAIKMRSISKSPPALPYLEPHDPFPDVSAAWGPESPAPGLLAAGADLSLERLVDAYSHGIFPWFSPGEPILWWSTEPRMVLHTEHLKLQRSMLKTLKRFTRQSGCEIKFDTHFEGVISACAGVSRARQGGTWITPEMVQAYTRLHQAGLAHSVETWVQGELVGGLYCVALGRAVFGESMFSLASDASKIALFALVAFCRDQGIELIDCQQQTPHLESLGAQPMARQDFLVKAQHAMRLGSPSWDFKPIYWQKIHPSLSPT